MAIQQRSRIKSLVDRIIHSESDNKEQSIENLYLKYKDTLNKAIQLGLDDKLSIYPETVWLRATANCNLHCIMCDGSFKRDNYHITENELINILVDNSGNEVIFGKINKFDFTSGEPLINLDFHNIVKRCKQLYPNAEISICSNMTFPIEGNVKEALQYIDNIGISIDGATKEVYEYIRHGADFYKTLKNIEDLIRLKNGNTDRLVLLFVAMTINLDHITRLIKLAHYFGIKSVFVQHLEIRQGLKNDMRKYLLSNLPNDKIERVVSEAREEARRLGITLGITDIYSNTLNENCSCWFCSDIESETLKKMCKIPWINSPSLRKDQNGIYPETICCHMPNDSDCSLKDKPYLRNISIKELYNSKDYWNIRYRLLNGELTNTACVGCQYYKAYTWTEQELRNLQEVIL